MDFEWRSLSLLFAYDLLWSHDLRKFWTDKESKSSVHIIGTAKLYFFFLYLWLLICVGLWSSDNDVSIDYRIGMIWCNLWRKSCFTFLCIYAYIEYG